LLVLLQIRGLLVRYYVVAHVLVELNRLQLYLGLNAPSHFATEGIGMPQYRPLLGCRNRCNYGQDYLFVDADWFYHSASKSVALVMFEIMDLGRRQIAPGNLRHPDKLGCSIQRL